MSPKTPKPRNELLFRRILDEGLLLDLEADEGYSLNPVATRIFQLLREGVHGDRLVERLRAEFEVDETRCRQELTQFVEELESKGLIESS